VPVTAKLSKAFYDRLGEEVADELVEWFNQVDATYRTDLRALNELNFARFDAKLEQRLAELRAELNTKIDHVAAELNAKIDRVAAQLDAKIDRVAAELRAELKATLEQRLGEQTRWLFVAWASLLVPIIIVLLRK
jgi:DNA anti-recombination protein RmuC